MDAPADEGCVLVQGGAVDADGNLAASAERFEGGAFGVDGEAGLGVVERGDGVADVDVVGGFGEDGIGCGASLEGERALAGCGAELVEGKTLVDRFGAVEAVEAGAGEDEGVTVAGVELAESGVDVAAELDELHVGAQGEELGAAAWAGGADAASHG